MNIDDKSIENSRIERLKKSLYSRNVDVVPKDERTAIKPDSVEAPTSWGAPKTFEYTIDPMSKGRNNSFFNKFLLISGVLFLAALAGAVYIFYGGVNMISSNNLDVKIVAPSSISSGEELPIGLTIINGNRTDLEDVVMYVDYPEGSQAINSEKQLTHEKIILGKIAKGGSMEYSLRSVLFGEKDVTRDFNFRIEYRVNGSNATFAKEKTYAVSVGSAPVLMSIDYPKETNSGQDVTLKINLTSNSSVNLKNTLVRLDYPYGFTYKSSSLKPVRNNSVWNMGELKDGEKKTLELSGVLVGQNQEDKTFKVTVGTKSADVTKDFDATLAEQDITLGIRKSFFDLVVTGDSRSTVKIGDYTSVSIKWQNTLPEKIINTKITAKVSGNVLDRSKVSPDINGYYESVSNSVVWDKNNLEELTQMSPGEGGRVSFNVGSYSDFNLTKNVKNPHIDIHVVVEGDRAGSEGGTVTSVSDYTVKILTTLGFTSKSYRSVGPLQNNGPIPPRADKETTYTINWVFTNTTNDVSTVVAKAQLPNGVNWKGEVSPNSEKISYDPDSRTVTWNVGNISAGTGYSNSPRAVYFKVGLVPSISQLQSTVDLVSRVDVSSKDLYVEAPITFTIPQVTTFVSDPGFKSNDGLIAQ